MSKPKVQMNLKFQIMNPLSFVIHLTFGFCHLKFSIASAIERSLAWIHNIIRIQGFLNLPHQCHFYSIVFQGHIVRFGEADAMFTRQGPLEGDG